MGIFGNVTAWHFRNKQKQPLGKYPYPKNLNQTDCNYATNISDSNLQYQISLTNQKWAFVTSIWAIGATLTCFLAGPASDDREL